MAHIATAIAVFAVLAVLAITVIVAVLLLRHVDAVDSDRHLRQLIVCTQTVDEVET